MLLTHIRRQGGLKHQTVIEVVSHDKVIGDHYIAAAWQEKSDWYRNIQQNLTVGAQVRKHSFEASAKHTSAREAKEQLWDYAQKYPTAFGELVTVMLGEHLPPDKEGYRKVAGTILLISLTKIG